MSAAQGHQAAAPARVVLVTGASRGVGRAVALQQLASGARVVGTYRARHDAAAEVAAAARAAGAADGQLALLAADGSAAEGREAVAAACRAQLSASAALAGIVLAAGVSLRLPFDALDHDGRDPIALQLHDDLQAPLLLLRALWRAGLVGAGTSVVAITSNLARRGIADKAAYAAAKGGLEAAVRALAHEWGPAGVRVNAVAPGLLRTDMTAELGEAGYAAVAASVPLRRVGTAEDVAGPAGFLLADAAAYVTGHVLDVDGGWLAAGA